MLEGTHEHRQSAGFGFRALGRGGGCDGCSRWRPTICMARPLRVSGRRLQGVSLRESTRSGARLDTRVPEAADRMLRSFEANIRPELSPADLEELFTQHLRPESGLLPRSWDGSCLASATTAVPSWSGCGSSCVTLGLSERRESCPIISSACPVGSRERMEGDGCPRVSPRDAVGAGAGPHDAAAVSKREDESLREGHEVAPCSGTSSVADFGAGERETHGRRPLVHAGRDWDDPPWEGAMMDWRTGLHGSTLLHGAAVSLHHAVLPHDDSALSGRSGSATRASRRSSWRTSSTSGHWSRSTTEFSPCWRGMWSPFSMPRQILAWNSVPLRLYILEDHGADLRNPHGRRVSEPSW